MASTDASELDGAAQGSPSTEISANPAARHDEAPGSRRRTASTDLSEPRDGAAGSRRAGAPADGAEQGNGGDIALRDVPSVKSAERTVRILETLAASPTKLTLAELQERMGYPRSSLHALVRTLRELKWVEADATGSAFGVGPHALLSGTAYLDRDPALPYACEALEDLRSEIGYTTHYARRDGAHVLYLASRDRRDSVRLFSRVGRRLPAHITALGQSLLAALTPEEVDEVLPDVLEEFTPETFTSIRLLHEELDRVRIRGWAFESEQGTPGVACVAAVVDYRIPATDAISCSMPVAKVNAREVRRVATALVTTTQELATKLRRAGIR